MSLLNEKNENDLDEVDVVAGPIENIAEEEVEKASKGMKNRKPLGPSGVNSDMRKRADRTGVRELTNLSTPKNIKREDKS